MLELLKIYIFWFLFQAAIINSNILYHHFVDAPDIQTRNFKTMGCRGVHRISQSRVQFTHTLGV